MVFLHDHACMGDHNVFYAQMLPLLKRSSDNLVAVISEKATSEGSFDVVKYVIMTSVPCTTCILDLSLIHI